MDPILTTTVNGTQISLLVDGTEHLLIVLDVDTQTHYKCVLNVESISEELCYDVNLCYVLFTRAPLTEDEKLRLRSIPLPVTLKMFLRPLPAEPEGYATTYGDVFDKLHEIWSPDNLEGSICKYQDSVQLHDASFEETRWFWSQNSRQNDIDRTRKNAGC